MPKSNASPSSEVILRNLERLRQRRDAVDRLIASLESYGALLETEMQSLSGLPPKPGCRAEVQNRRGTHAA